MFYEWAYTEKLTVTSVHPKATVAGHIILQLQELTLGKWDVGAFTRGTSLFIPEAWGNFKAYKTTGTRRTWTWHLITAAAKPLAGWMAKAQLREARSQNQHQPHCS